MIPELDAVNDPAYLNDLTGREIDEIRAMRTHCQDLENATSYVRRFAQGRIDLVGGIEQVTDTTDLPASLAGGALAGSEATARPPQSLEPNPFAEKLLEVLDGVVAPSQINLSSVPEPEERNEMVAQLSSFERSISAHRSQLHDVIGTIQAEIVRRYRTGEADAGRLLS